MLSSDFLFPRFFVVPLANPSNFSHCKCFSSRYNNAWKRKVTYRPLSWRWSIGIENFFYNHGYSKNDSVLMITYCLLQHVGETSGDVQ